MKTTVYIQNHEHLRRKTGISWKKHMHNKVSQAYHLREFCDGGNSHPNATLKKIKCHVSVDQQYHSKLELLLSHLFPNETPKLERTATTTANT
jgi:hypothetical protein